MLNLLLLAIVFQLSDYILVRNFGWITANFSGIRFTVNFLFSFIGITGIVYLIRTLSRSKAGFLIVSVVFTIISIIQLSYYATYDKMVPPFGFGFFSENFALTLQLYFQNFPVLKSFAAVCVLSTLFVILKKTYKPVSIMKIVVALVVSLASISHSIFGWFSVPEFQHSVIAFATSGAEAAFHKANAFKVNRPKLTAISPKQRNKQSIIWIIGESTTKSHMSVYGYNRKTTPFLDSLKNNRKLYLFDNAVTPGNKTNLVIPYLLTGLEGPDPKGRVYQNPTIFQYAKTAGYITAFFSAQDFKWGKLEKILIDENVDYYRDGSSLSSSVSVLKGADDMLFFNKRIKPWLDSIAEPFLLILQMDGSHYPYTDHSPAAFKRFLPEPSPNSIEAYDNSIAYTDHFLANLYEAFSSKPSAGWMFFTPDHGQSLGAGKNRYNDNYDTDVIEIPAIAFSVGVNNYDTVLASNMPAPISSVDVFATILDLLELEPAMKIDGYSLFKKIPDDRIRICSEYMPTFHNNPNAAFILPDKSTFRIDFTRGTFSRLGEMEKTSMPINKLPENVTLLLNSRMKTVDEN